MALTAPIIDIRRSEDRFLTKMSWLDSKHSFSFGHHYDPQNTHFGLLLVSNDDVVKAGTGFDTHPHRDMEIVTILGAPEWSNLGSFLNAAEHDSGLQQWREYRATTVERAGLRAPLAYPPGISVPVRE